MGAAVPYAHRPRADRGRSHAAAPTQAMEVSQMQSKTRAARTRRYLSRHERQRAARAEAFSRRTAAVPAACPPMDLGPDALALIDQFVRDDRTAVSSALLAVPASAPAKWPGGPCSHRSARRPAGRRPRARSARTERHRSLGMSNGHSVAPPAADRSDKVSRTARYAPRAPPRLLAVKATAPGLAVLGKERRQGMGHRYAHEQTWAAVDSWLVSRPLAELLRGDVAETVRGGGPAPRAARLPGANSDEHH
jgi:hypothetical protein